MNVVVLQGNLTRDPELRYIGEKKTPVVNFGLAVNRHFTKNNGDKDKEVNFFECEAWDSGAETIAKYVKKGNPLLVQGSLKNDTYEKDGQKVTKTKVRVSGFNLLYSNKNSEANPTDEKEENAGEPAAAASESPAGADIPF